MLSGKDKGKQGKILKVFSQSGHVLVEGLNLVTKHVRARRQGQKGQKVQVPRKVFAGKVQLVCPNCSKPTRAGWNIQGETKERICKKCGRSIK